MIPENPIGFIRQCLQERKILWTYHVQIATDVAGDQVRMVTAYEPDPAVWDENFKIRRRPE